MVFSALSGHSAVKSLSHFALRNPERRTLTGGKCGAFYESGGSVGSRDTEVDDSVGSDGGVNVGAEVGISVGSGVLVSVGSGVSEGVGSSVGVLVGVSVSVAVASGVPAVGEAVIVVSGVGVPHSEGVEVYAGVTVDTLGT
jgi:hypothetical protein